MKTIFEKARRIPVEGEYGICVIGGSCTGVFAAVRFQAVITDSYR